MSGEGTIPAGPAEIRGVSGDVPPLLTFSEAEGVGGALHDYLEKQLGAAPMTRDDMGWGDLVQFVLRRASETVRDREEKEQSDG